MLKSITLIILSIFGFNISANSSTPKDCQLNETFILIHGIGGSQRSFWKMKESIEAKYPCSKAIEFSYETRNSKKTTLDFAKKLDKLISNTKQTKPKDINLVMHSQGGLVGLNWMLNSFKKQKGFHKSNLLRLNRYISMSTPFWGSDYALMGKTVFYSLGVEDNIVSPFGKKQLHYMKYGSSFYMNMIDYLTSEESDDFKHFLKNDIQMLNIIGAVPLPKILADSKFAQFYEGDMVVNVPSMKINFNYAQTQNKSYSPHNIEIALAEPINFASESYAHGAHLKMLPNAPGIVFVPSSCIKFEECEHRPFLNLINYVETQNVDSNEEIHESIRGFDLHVIVDLPKGLEDLEDDLEIVALDSKDESISLSRYLFRHTEQEPLQIIDNRAYFVFKGSIMTDAIDDTVHFDFKIKHPQIKSRIIRTYVQKGRITFLKTNVQKNKEQKSRFNLLRFLGL